MSSSSESFSTRFPDVIYGVSDAAVQSAYSPSSDSVRSRSSFDTPSYVNGELVIARAHEEAWATAKSLAKIMGCDFRHLDIQPDGSVIVRNNPVR